MEKMCYLLMLVMAVSDIDNILTVTILYCGHSTIYSHLHCVSKKFLPFKCL